MPYRPAEGLPGFVPVDPNLIVEDPMEWLRLQQRNLASRGVTISVPELRQMFTEQFGFDPVTASAEARNGFATAAGLNDAFNEVILTSMENHIKSKQDTRSNTVGSTKETVRRYVDIPTAAEVVDDFEVGLKAHITNLLGAGQLAPRDADILLDPRQGMMERLFDAYIGELGSRAARGENIFDVVGVTGPNVPLGSRPGEQVTEQTDETTTGTQTTTTEQTQQGTVEGGGAPPAGTLNPPTTTTQEEEFTSQQTGQNTLQQTEEVVGRPKIGLVYKFSPLDYLNTHFKTSGALATFIQSKKKEHQNISSAQRVV